VLVLFQPLEADHALRADRAPHAAPALISTDTFQTVIIGRVLVYDGHGQLCAKTY